MIRKESLLMGEKGNELKKRLFPMIALLISEQGNNKANWMTVNCACHNIAENPEILTEENFKKFESRANQDKSARAQIMAGVFTFAYLEKLAGKNVL